MKSQSSDDAIRHLVWSGFYRPAEVREMINRLDATPGQADQAAIALAIDQEFARKAEQEASWPPVTDPDRLTAAFDELNRSGILAVQNAGQGQEDGFDTVTQRYREQAGVLPPLEGYCFFHRQDLAHAVDDEGLLLAFGDLRGDQERATEIGRRIVQVLHAHGFETEWLGSYAHRIEIPGIVWQRRGP